MKAKNIVLSRSLPKTGQDVEYEAGDDGTYQAGWWKGRTIETNKTRFIVKTIGLIDVVVDKATDLMWARDFSGVGGNGGVAAASWNVAVAYCLALDFAGFTDWRLPNLIELITIVQYNAAAGSPYVYDSFQNIPLGDIWSSTTYPAATTEVYGVRTTDSIVRRLAKTDATNYLLSVR